MPFFISKKLGEISISETFSKKKSILAILAYTLLKINIFRSAMFLLRHCDVIHWPIFMILVSMERGDPTLYYGTKQLFFGHVNFKITRGGVVTIPLRKTCYKKLQKKKKKKGSGRQGLIHL